MSLIMLSGRQRVGLAPWRGYQLHLYLVQLEAGESPTLVKQAFRAELRAWKEEKRIGTGANGDAFTSMLTSASEEWLD